MNRKKTGILMVILFLGSGLVPSMVGGDIDSKRYMVQERQNNDSTTNCIEAFYLYIGKIRNLTIVEDADREYYQWYAVQLFVFWIYTSNILPCEMGLKMYTDYAFYFLTVPVDEFHGKINSDSISGYYLWV